jgi:hypothetical protein
MKRLKLEQKGLEKVHQREREREQHQLQMMRMKVMLMQSSQGAPGASRNESVFQGFGLLDELNDPSLPSGSSYSI